LFLVLGGKIYYRVFVEIINSFILSFHSLTGLFCCLEEIQIWNCFVDLLLLFFFHVIDKKMIKKFVFFHVDKKMIKKISCQMRPFFPIVIFVACGLLGFVKNK